MFSIKAVSTGAVATVAAASVLAVTWHSPAASPDARAPQPTVVAPAPGAAPLPVNVTFEGAVSSFKTSRTATMTAPEIPSTALAAYQNAAAMMATARPECGLRWELLAAVGSVASDHGRVGGRVLGTDGRITPRLRAAGVRGPMRLQPDAWAGIGVDADNDGLRRIGDLDDASLAVAAVLCHDGGDLGQQADRRKALRQLHTGRVYAQKVESAYELYTSQTYADVHVTSYALPPMDVMPIETIATGLAPKAVVTASTSAPVFVLASQTPAPTTAPPTTAPTTPLPTTSPTVVPTPTVSATPPAQTAAELCGAHGFVDPELADCIADQPALVNAQIACAMLEVGLNDVARTDDDFDLCVREQFPAWHGATTPTPSVAPTEVAVLPSATAIP
ncbi:MAG: hypothetical protein V9G04_00585 [Nocardioides sp.]